MQGAASETTTPPESCSSFELSRASASGRKRRSLSSTNFGAVPRGLHALKYFCENAPQYHIAATASYLGAADPTEGAFPVGKVDLLRLHPLSFGEFLDALGLHSHREMLKSSDWQAIGLFVGKFLDLFRQYCFVGGMPEAAVVFRERKDPAEVCEIQKRMLANIRQEIVERTHKRTGANCLKLLEALPLELADPKPEVQLQRRASGR